MTVIYYSMDFFHFNVHVLIQIQLYEYYDYYQFNNPS
jgi:hypothetical protein